MRVDHATLVDDIENTFKHDGHVHVSVNPAVECRVRGARARQRTFLVPERLIVTAVP